jgi:hypothetical protein
LSTPIRPASAGVCGDGELRVVRAPARTQKNFSTYRKPALNKGFFAAADLFARVRRCAAWRALDRAANMAWRGNARLIGVSGVNPFFRRFAVFFISL